MHVRPYTPDDEQAVLDLRVTAFGSGVHVALEDAQDTEYIPDDRRIVAEADGRVVGHWGAWAFHHVVGSTPVQTGGVAGVAIAMEWRGRGVGSGLQQAGLELMARKGDVLSTLYPSIPGFYRRWGWEVAGETHRRGVPTVALAGLAPPPDDVTVRPLAWDDDMSAVTAVHEAVVATEPGGLLGGTPWLRRCIEPDPDDGTFAFVAERGDDLVGVLSGNKDKPATPMSPWDVNIDILAATDWDAERALWRMVATNAPVAAMTFFRGWPTCGLLTHLDTAMAPPTERSHPWMARLVDAPGAFAARDWPRVDVDLPLRIVDAKVAANDGVWRLQAADGRAGLTRTDDEIPDAPTITIAGLSQLYIGATTPRAAAHQGRLRDADDATLDLLTALFAGPAPQLRVTF